ncbi:MAG TPA: transglycosylase domain-containing protein [Turneriella sp.]|nr:transglycosylase domain-containing protein [Turneriella sp.]HNL10912.1 transglycosylase domain-containing protein [Turneriella sp.]
MKFVHYLKRFYEIFIRGKITLYLLLIVAYFGVRTFLAYNRWNDEEPAILQKLTLYKQQLDRLRSGAIAEDTVASIEPGAVAIPSKVFDRHNKLVGEFYTERRSLLNYEHFPPFVTDALMASEDRRFYEHHGIDYAGIMRAVIRNLLHFRFAQGGSTLTQQLAKVLFTNQEKTLDRKLFEYFCARAIEERYSKKEILEMYFNLIYMGHGIYGLETASQFYFNKSARALTVGEAAALVGVIPNPKAYSPMGDLPRFLERQLAVMRSMVAIGKLTEDKLKNERRRFFQAWRIAAKDSKQSGIGDFPDRMTGKNYAPFFLDYLRQKLTAQFSQDALTRSGLRIYTTLDLGRQIAAQKAVKAAVELQKQHYEKLLAGARKKNNAAKIQEYEKALATTNAAFISIEPKTGYILTMVGGGEFSSQNQFNRALKAERQIGSTIKPLIYYLALQRQILTPASLIADEPLQDYQNYDGKFLGPITLLDALKLSRNPTAIRALQKLDFDDLRSLFHEVLQLPYSDLEKKIPRELGVALGSSSFTPLQLAQMYATMLNQGRRVEPRDLLRIEDSQGRQIWEAPEVAAQPQVMDAAAAYVTITMMQAVVDGGGTAQPAMKTLRNAEGHLAFEVAGKTGTTSKYVDAWFVGLVSDEATVMWVGNDVNTSLGAGRSGSGLCAPRYADYLRTTRYDNKPRPFTEVFEQDRIVRKSFCSKTGLLSRFPGACEGEILDQAFIRGTEPTEFDPSGAPVENGVTPQEPQAPVAPVETNPPVAPPATPAEPPQG